MKFFIFLIVLIFLSACGGRETTRNVPVEVTPVSICTDELKADPVVMRSAVPSILEDVDGDVWVAFTFQHYENMSLNIQDILVHLRQKNAILSYYRRCIDGTLTEIYKKEKQ